jgi:hypothetical protein
VFPVARQREILLKMCEKVNMMDGVRISDLVEK